MGLVEGNYIQISPHLEGNIKPSHRLEAQAKQGAKDKTRQDNIFRIQREWMKEQKTRQTDCHDGNPSCKTKAHEGETNKS